MSRIRIGNQTAFSAPHALEPLAFAIAHGFDAFEWFSDKKNTGGWDEMDMDPAERRRVKQQGQTHDIQYTVHAPWQANPLYPDGEGLLKRSLDFAADIGADLVNLHLYMDQGPQTYVDSLRDIIRYAAQLGVRLSIENTPLTTPENFNATFACLKQLSINTDHVGMCLDIGHANLCQTTHNDYIRYIDELATDLPIIHLHIHENHGDHDKHLTLFTGPAKHNDGGVREFIKRMKQRHYSGAMIMEQWPQPTTLLVEAEHKLRMMLDPYGKKKHSTAPT